MTSHEDVTKFLSIISYVKLPYARAGMIPDGGTPWANKSFDGRVDGACCRRLCIRVGRRMAFP